jgi:uncharacterized protein (TIGR02246 family)
MKRWLELLITVVLALGTVSATLSADTKTEVRKAIDSGNARYIEAFAKRDAAALAALYDDDGVRFGQKGAYARGRAGITEDVAKFIKAVAGPIKVTIETEDLWVVDDLAYETGKYSYTFTPAGEKETKSDGHYVTIWKKQRDGGWRIVADIGVPRD